MKWKEKKFSEHESDISKRKKVCKPKSFEGDFLLVFVSLYNGVKN